MSIVNTDRPEVQGYGYFAGKKAQEETARRFSPALTIVRTTQWFEFGAQVLQRNRLGPLGFVPGMRIKPIALEAAARVLAETASGKRGGDLVEVSGPEEMTLWELVRRTPGPGESFRLLCSCPPASGAHSGGEPCSRIPGWRRSDRGWRTGRIARIHPDGKSSLTDR